MENPHDSNLIETVKEALQNNDPALAAAKIKEHMEKQNNAPLNIAITGEAGSGKSTFVNAFRGVGDEDEGAAPAGSVETTTEVKSYPHPNFPNVTLWDLPGIGTTKFPAAKYLKKVGFQKFDFFIIISADRFRENDAMLAKEIQRMGKKFYFVRSKIDDNLRAEEKRKKGFNEEKTLSQIREYCIKSLQKQGFESPQVFLVSSFDLHHYDFQLLMKTLEEELPEHKRHALLMAMPNISLEIINKKEEAFKANIKYIATLSALVAAVPVPGLSIAADIGVLVSVVTQCVLGFGLDILSLGRLAKCTNVPLDDLLGVILSPLAATEVTFELVWNSLLECATTAALIAVEEAFRFIPLFGIPAAMATSFVTIYRALCRILKKLAEDAQRVFKRVLGLNTSV